MTTSEILMTDPTTEEGRKYWAARRRFEEWQEAQADLLGVLERCESRLATAVEKHFTGYVGDRELLADIRAAIAKAKETSQ